MYICSNMGKKENIVKVTIGRLRFSKGITFLRNLSAREINGILGTIAFHLLIVAAFMFSRLSTVNNEHHQAFLIDFEEEVATESPDTETLEQRVFGDDGQRDQTQQEARRNIAVSESEARESDRPVPDQFRDYSSREMEELDNRVDDILNNASDGNLPEPEQPEVDFEEKDFGELYRGDEESDEPYTGPTNIYYDLSERTSLYIPVPVYKCPEGGVVTVDIKVDRKGNVTDASVEQEPSDFNERCLQQEALQAALGSRFDEKSDAPAQQEGTITFHFQSQRR